MNKIKLVLLTLMLMTASFVVAQTPSVKAEIDSTVLLIGEQARLTYKVFNSKGTIIPPVFADTIITDLEIVDRSIDTVAIDGAVEVDYSFIVTAFDSALFYIPEMPFVLDGDTFLSNALSLKVMTIPVDTTEMAITDIKPIEKAPFNWKEWALYALILLLIGLAAWLGFVFYKRWKNRPAEGEEEVKEEQRAPADEEALAALQLLAKEDLLMRGQYKIYQTRLVDVLRVFIERTFEVPTMERTSDEILSSLNQLKKKSADTYDDLRQILSLADLVKFAKYNPPVDEHQQSMSKAEDFVREATAWKHQQDAQMSETEKQK